ncbi:MAG: radical SAM protein [Candidatus Thermoplasmatota archaeon]
MDKRRGEKNLSKESPEYVRISTAAAITLKYFPGRFYRNAKLTGLNLLVTYKNGCKASCAYCGLSKMSRGNSFIRVSWPIVEVNDLIERSLLYGKNFKRVCVGMITHPYAPRDICEIIEKFKKRTNLKISALITPTLIGKKELKKIKSAGADIATIAIDCATEKIFENFRRTHKWSRYWQILKEAVEIFGRNNVGIHLIVGLGESEKEMVDTIQRAYDIGTKTHLFSFYPEEGSVLERWERPTYGNYRRIQIANYIINNYGDSSGFKYNEKNQIIDFGIDINKILDGKIFMTSGCPDENGEVACNRPFGNERPSEFIRNFPFLPNDEDMEGIKKQIWEY